MSYSLGLPPALARPRVGGPFGEGRGARWCVPPLCAPLWQVTRAYVHTTDIPNTGGVDLPMGEVRHAHYRGIFHPNRPCSKPADTRPDLVKDTTVAEIAAKARGAKGGLHGPGTGGSILLELYLFLLHLHCAHLLLRRLPPRPGGVKRGPSWTRYRPVLCLMQLQCAHPLLGDCCQGQGVPQGEAVYGRGTGCSCSVA